MSHPVALHRSFLGALGHRLAILATKRRFSPKLTHFLADTATSWRNRPDVRAQVLESAATPV
jgi:hypothetical protein